MSTLPLNGDALLSAARSNLNYPTSAARVLSAALKGELDPEYSPSGEDAPDGTNGAVKTETATRSRAVDPSQGYGAPRRRASHDPLTEQLLRVIERR